MPYLFKNFKKKNNTDAFFTKLTKYFEYIKTLTLIPWNPEIKTVWETFQKHFQTFAWYKMCA